ncbi:MAG: hypothetical protein CMM56_06970 [Rhodospirillaceae bacterium]|nr:hypothetical protein [Rhodospirillaceae bacterium]
MNHSTSRTFSFSIFFCIAFYVSFASEAAIVNINITSVESPTFSGRSFGSVGQYEKLHGRAYGELDPTDPHNAIITDINLAPRNANGKVEYSMDIFILKPIDMNRGNQKLFLDMNNRGEMRVGRLNDVAVSNDPVSAADGGNGFIMNQGYTIVGNGWDFGAVRDNMGLTISVPVAKNSDGSVITGPSYEYITFNNSETYSYTLTYPTASINNETANLTVRERLDDSPKNIPITDWEFIDEKTIRLLPVGTTFNQAHIYEFTYTAKNPVVSGIGLAATRDFISFLRYTPKSEDRIHNPLAENVKQTYSFSISQPSRALHDFQTLGFNADEQGRQVIDGMLKWTGAGTGDQINYRFSQTGRTERNRQNHLYPEGVFPFAHQVLTDHLSGKVAGRRTLCEESNTCAKIFEVNSSNEYWVKTGSLLHSDTRGKDIEDPEDVRFFLVSGTSHGVGDVNSRGICQQFLNPTSPYPVLRSLFIALDSWVANEVEPPTSRVPSHSDGTAIMAIPIPGSNTGRVPQDALGWPSIPNVNYTGLITTRHYLNFGPLFDSESIISNYPPSIENRPSYGIFVSRVDIDGNEIAGIRLPPVEVPIGTTTGWALRRQEFGMNDGCEGSGQFIPFSITKDERISLGDPRLSLEERYGSHENYVQEVTIVARELMRQRFLLEDDVQAYIEQALNRDFL